VWQGTCISAGGVNGSLRGSRRTRNIQHLAFAPVRMMRRHHDRPQPRIKHRHSPGGRAVQPMKSQAIAPDGGPAFDDDQGTTRNGGALPPACRLTFATFNDDQGAARNGGQGWQRLHLRVVKDLSAIKKPVREFITSVRAGRQARKSEHDCRFVVCRYELPQSKMTRITQA
jgi:hypothetical protein